MVDTTDSDDAESSTLRCNVGTLEANRLEVIRGVVKSEAKVVSCFFFFLCIGG